jgi:mannose-6-phosphate isomerase-like protein (cupin superfamily)
MCQDRQGGDGERAPERPRGVEAMTSETNGRRPIHLPPGGGRAYPTGRISSVFKADGAETAGRYSISEWWLEPHTKGPGAHNHPEDDVFYVLEGTMSFLIGDDWLDAPRGSFVLAPGGVTHDFENRSDGRAGVLNLSIPGSFEEGMPEIARWFAENPPGDARW